MFDDICYLIAENREQDEAGVWRVEPSKRRVFCKVQSVTGNEFFQGGRNGLNPEFRINVFAGDYKGERTLEYAGQTYSIYRTYVSATGQSSTGMDYIELYVERKGGINGIQRD